MLFTVKKEALSQEIADLVQVLSEEYPVSFEG